MDASLSAALLAAQQVLVLRPDDTGGVTLVPPLPDWVHDLEQPPRGGAGPFRAEELFPYLQACLLEVRAVWEGAAPSPYRSGWWTERTRAGEELPLEATALRLDLGSFLLVRRVDPEYSARRQVLQLARERMLDHERLLKEISVKEVLLHCIVHDLAGPLSSIQGCLEILARDGLVPENAEFVQLGLLQVGRQNRLIRDLLDVFAAQISSLERSGADLAQAPELTACVAEVVEGLRPAFLVKQVALRAEFAGGLAVPCRVVAERSRLERVLYNLLENALRFAPPGSAVAVQVTDEGDWVSVTVADAGPGVAPEIRSQLFQRFVKGGRLPGKSGLGLFFCRITVERWGGGIECESSPGSGARFRDPIAAGTASGRVGGSLGE